MNKKISELDNLTAASQADTNLIEVAKPSTAENFKFTWANVKAALKTYFDTLYTAIATFNAHVATFEDHSARHEDGGADEISVASMSGELADDQPPKEHSNTKHSTNLVGETGVITAMTGKTTPVDADVAVIEDSEASNIVKKLSWTNIKATLKTYFDTLYEATGAVTPTALTIIPLPMALMAGAASATLNSNICNSNTTLQLGMIILPFGITVSKITFHIVTVTAAGTLKLVVYSEDGQTKHIDHTTASISTDGEKTETLAAPVELVAGVYYFGILSVDTANLNVAFWYTVDMTVYGGDVEGEPTLEGHLTVTADTPPATITPVDIAYAGANTPYFRLDN